MHETWIILLAAGSGSRMAGAAPCPKQFLPYRGQPLYWHSIHALSRVAQVTGVAIVLPHTHFDKAKQAALSELHAVPCNVPCLFVQGGERRQDSVYKGLMALPDTCTRVLVHDSARPFASPALAVSLLAGLDKGHVAVVPGLAVKDTIKRVAVGQGVQTLPRHELIAVQTPQAFSRNVLVRAHLFCQNQHIAVTDDASMVEAMGEAISIVPGEEGNIKITIPEDLSMLENKEQHMVPVTGWGYDTHKYGPGRPLILGGVSITGGPKVQAHSDGDVLLHALIDAILGCLCRGDIGHHFPDTDTKYANISSQILLAEVLELAREDKLVLTHVDLTLVCQVPKLAPWSEKIRKKVAAALEIPVQFVNIKATTEEGLGFTGREEGIKSMACVTGLRPKL